MDEVKEILRKYGLGVQVAYGKTEELNQNLTDGNVSVEDFFSKGFDVLIIENRDFTEKLMGMDKYKTVPRYFTKEVCLVADDESERMLLKERLVSGAIAYEQRWEKILMDISVDISWQEDKFAEKYKEYKLTKIFDAKKAKQLLIKQLLKERENFIQQGMCTHKAKQLYEELKIVINKQSD